MAAKKTERKAAIESGSAYQSRFAPLLRNSRLRNPKLSAWRADFEDDAFAIGRPARRPHPIRRRGEIGQLALLPGRNVHRPYIPNAIATAGECDLLFVRR